ncbi:MAG: hypothetical protein EOP06_09345 [Proteobacteria bacterium]|nr:MAG: hypothetical protein EOP06_09345 [Pseudomonadota bacterium]
MINLIAHLLGYNLHVRLVQKFSAGIALWGAFFAAAIVISLINLVVCTLVLNVMNRICGKEGINPFT